LNQKEFPEFCGVDPGNTTPPTRHRLEPGQTPAVRPEGPAATTIVPHLRDTEAWYKLATRSHSGPPGGLDTLHVGLYGSWDKDAWPRVEAVLDRCLEAEQNDDWLNSMFKVQVSDEPAPTKIEVQPGFKLGVRYRWAITSGEGVKVAILNRQEISDKFASVVVQLGSLPLTLQGLGAYRKVLAILGRMGFRVERECISRVDICVDLVGVAMSDVGKLTESGQYICRAHGRATHHAGQRVETVTFGDKARTLVCRIYDKVRELLGDDPVKYAKYLALKPRWGTDELVDVTRVEFELRRDTLRERLVNTVNDLISKAPSLCRWLTGQWLRLTADPVDRENRHQDRARVHRLWKLVRVRFDQVAKSLGNDAVACFLPPSVRVASIHALTLQTRGMLASLAARAGMTLAQVAVFVHDELLNSEFEQKLAQRSDAFNTSGIGPYIAPEVA
jgi:hypothetical protein